MLLSIIGAMSTFDIILATTDGRFNTRTMAYDVYKETFREVWKWAFLQRYPLFSS